jgi:hypothetical protein
LRPRIESDHAVSLIKVSNLLSPNVCASTPAGNKNERGLAPGFPASITRKETPSATSTTREDGTFDSAPIDSAPRQMAALRQKSLNLIRDIFPILFRAG